MAVKKILIVEDQALVRMYLCSCVEKSKECEVAGMLTRADAALQRCGEGHIDLILMDICTENDSDENCDGHLDVRRTFSRPSKKNRSR